MTVEVLALTSWSNTVDLKSPIQQLIEQHSTVQRGEPPPGSQFAQPHTRPDPIAVETLGRPDLTMADVYALIGHVNATVFWLKGVVYAPGTVRLRTAEQKGDGWHLEFRVAPDDRTWDEYYQMQGFQQGIAVAAFARGDLGRLI